MGRLSFAAVGFFLLWIPACHTKTASVPSGRMQADRAPVITPALRPTEPDDGQWLMASKNYANTRYSDLNQINTQNVKNLKLAWTFSTGLVRGHEAAPLIVNRTMYLVTPFRNYLYALDLANNGELKWVYKPDPVAAAGMLLSLMFVVVILAQGVSLWMAARCE